MKKKLSITDIAKHLGISITTISFILNGRAKEKRISDDVVERVLKATEELGYKPSALARSFRTGKSNTIGLMVEDISNPFFAAIARAIEDKAYDSGYKIFYCSTGNDTQKTKDYIQMFKDRQVDGYIITPSYGIEDDVNSLLSLDIPVVLFDRYLPEVYTDFVIVDNEEATFKASEYLIDKGRKNIAFVTIDSLQSQMQGRLKGYEKALNQHGLNHHLKEIPYNSSRDYIELQMMAFFERKTNIDAVIFATNYLGVSGLKVMSDLKLKIPSDISVISFDDNDLFSLHSPRITAVAQPISDIAENLITVLLNKLNGKAKKGKIEKLILSTTFIERDSC